MFTDQARVESYLQRELNADEADLIDDIIEHVSTSISAYCNRNWLSVSPEDEDDTTELEPSTRIYNGSGTFDLYVDDFINLESVRLLDRQGVEYLKFDLDESMPNRDWIVTPANSNPKNHIKLRYYRFVQGISNIELTAIWGSGAVPRPVTVVATTLVAKFLLKMASSGIYRRERIEGYEYDLVQAKDIDDETDRLISTLDIYKRRTL